MAGVNTTRTRGQWGVAGVNAGVGLLVLVLVAVLALVVKPPAPPGIAAFAPQASKTITKAPQSQSSNFGSGAGQCAAGQACSLLPTTTTTPPTTTRRGVPSALQCYKWPDGTVTQTFDPQSPPCIASWDEAKGNGGATSPGVTASEIRVALPDWGTAPGYPGVKPIVDFFNTHYQFYGRKITIQPFTSQQANAQATSNFNQPDLQRADATQITTMKVFATTDFVEPLHYSWSLPVFRQILTDHKIVSLHGGEEVPYGSERDLEAHAPYEWSYYTPIDSVMRNFGVLTCRQLVGKPANHSRDGDLRSATRKFAAVLPAEDELGGPMPGLDTLKQALAACGVPDLKVVYFSFRDRALAAHMAPAMRQLHNDGVTSIYWFPDGGGSGASHPWQVANLVGYHPEWLMIGWNNYQSAFELENVPTESGSAFGVGVWNKFQPLGLEFWERAFIAAGGDAAQVHTGAITSGRAFYQELLLLAAGIQMAGPNLTPETFARGLHTTTFPNPGAGGPPFYQGRVGFEGSDVTMVNDMQAFWLDTRLPGQAVPQQPNNNEYLAMCYVNLGKRYSLDTWPTADGFYQNGVCR